MDSPSPVRFSTSSSTPRIGSAEPRGVEGALTLRQTGAKDWEADFQGDLHDIDMNTLVGRRFPSHRLSGLAHVGDQVGPLGDRPGQGMGWVEASGELTTGQGSMGTDLLNRSPPK